MRRLTKLLSTPKEFATILDKLGVMFTDINKAWLKLMFFLWI